MVDQEPQDGRTQFRVAATMIAVIAASQIDQLVPPLGNPLAVIVIWLICAGGWPTRLAPLGLGRPTSWRRTILGGVVLGVVLELIGLGLLFYVLPRFGVPLPDYSRFEEIRGNIPMLMVFLTVSWTTAGFAEEVIWRGFVMGRLAWLLGDAQRTWIVSLLGTSLIFGGLHAYQGPTGIVMTGVVGFLFGVAYLYNGRNLWLPIIAHGLNNTISFLILFFAPAEWLG